MVSYTVKQTVVENLNADLDGKQPAGDYPTNASLTESLQSNLLNYTTNRILEIPQDIKWRTDLVETDKKRYRLTILKGSVYYIPQGFEADGVTRKFSKRTMIADNTCPDIFWSDNALFEEFVFLVFEDNEAILTSGARAGCNITSGDTAPTTFLEQRALWYDTKNNYVKFTEDSGATWYNCSLPLLKGSPRNTIDETHPIAGWVNGPTQVFNGFGYIGKTVFLLPGVKFQTSQGKNIDGSIKTAIYTRSTVSISSLTTHTDHYYLMANGSVGNPFFIPKSQRFIQSYAPDTSNLVGINYWYNTSEERWYALNYDKTWKYMSGVMDIFGEASATNGLLYDFKGYPLNHINTYQRTELAGMGMPSNRYINLTLGASESTYRAPANGWFYFLGRWENAVPYLQMKNTTISGLEPRIQTCGASTTGYWGLYMPVRAGDVIKIYYNAAPTNVRLAFIYAQGDQ